MRERWVWDWTKTATYWPPSSSVFCSISFSFCWAAQPGSLKVQLSAGFDSQCLEMQQLTPNSKLTRTSYGTGLYNWLTSTCFLWASHLHPTQPVYIQVYPLIYSTGGICYLHRCISYLRARPGRRSICYTSTYIIVPTAFCKLFSGKHQHKPILSLSYFITISLRLI